MTNFITRVIKFFSKKSTQNVGAITDVDGTLVEAFVESRLYFKERFKDSGHDVWLTNRMAEVLARYASQRVIEEGISTLEASIEVQFELNCTYSGSEQQTLGVLLSAIRKGFVFENVEDMQYLLQNLHDRASDPITASCGALAHGRVMAGSLRLLDRIDAAIHSKNCDWYAEVRRDVRVPVVAMWLLECVDGDQTTAELAVNVAISAAKHQIGLYELRQFVKTHGFGEQLTKLLYLMRRNLISAQILEVFGAQPRAFSEAPTLELVLRLQGKSPEERRLALKQPVASMPEELNN